MATFKPREVLSILKKLGYSKVRQSGSHIIMHHVQMQRTVIVPMHAKDLKQGTLNSIIKQADSTIEMFIKLK